MVVKEVKSEKKCKDCGEPAYSFQVGWEEPETKIINWYSPRHYNQCKECRDEMYKKIMEKRKTSLNEDCANNE
ncbi:hypothetical protein LCGC14_1705780 [marine sediment metagenome]|uniref:Uncharacterized protein n=1 Tax=marine sediment metagenome TaxID=412755 RepID=A0A0F9HH54_9ZZZZ